MWIFKEKNFIFNGFFLLFFGVVCGLFCSATIYTTMTTDFESTIIFAPICIFVIIILFGFFVSIYEIVINAGSRLQTLQKIEESRYCYKFFHIYMSPFFISLLISSILFSLIFKYSGEYYINLLNVLFLDASILILWDIIVFNYAYKRYVYLITDNYEYYIGKHDLLKKLSFQFFFLLTFVSFIDYFIVKLPVAVIFLIFLLVTLIIKYITINILVPKAKNETNE